jgi:hypothetical protein
MNATETYDQLVTDIGRSLTLISSVRTIPEIQGLRKLPGYVYNPDVHLHEFWIAISQYSVAGDLYRLALLLNDRGLLLPSLFPNLYGSELDGPKLFSQLKRNKGNIIAHLHKVIGNPNMISPFSEIPIEDTLNHILVSIHNESMNLKFNYEQFLANDGVPKTEPSPELINI